MVLFQIMLRKESQSVDIVSRKPKFSTNTFIEACNLFETDLNSLIALQKGQQRRFSEKRQEGINKLEKKVVNRIRQTNPEILNRTGNFLRDKGSLEIAVYLQKLILKPQS